MNRANDHDWNGQVRRLLDAAADSLDADTLQHLNRARAAALAARRAPPRWKLPFAATLASAAVLVLALMLRPSVAPSPASVEAAEDTELFAGDDTLDLYQDLEFYTWLDTREAADG